MTRVSVWFVRAALLHFASGATLGAWQLATSSRVLGVTSLPLRGAHVEMVLIGWVCQLAFGVGLWILPFSRGVSSDYRFWVAWAALNLGVAVVSGAKVVGIPLIVLAGRFLEIASAVFIAWGLWSRVRPLPDRSR